MGDSRPGAQRSFALRSGAWMAVYLLVVLAPLLALLLGTHPPARDFWTEFSAAIGYAGLAMMGLQFGLTARPADLHVLIAGGIGITPMMSMLRTLADRGDGLRVILLYGNRDWDSITFREEIEDSPPDWTGSAGSSRRICCSGRCRRPCTRMSISSAGLGR